MKLALRLDLYRAATLEVPVDLVRDAEALGYHSVWSAEAYGTDALSPLAYLAALTTRIKLGTAVVQLAARPGDAGDARDDDRRPRRRRPGDHRRRRVRPPDRRGLVRPAMGAPHGAAARLPHDRPAGLRAGGAGGPRGAWRSPCPTGGRAALARASRCARSSTRPGASRCGWRRAGRATPSCAPSCARMAPDGAAARGHRGLPRRVRASGGPRVVAARRRGRCSAAATSRSPTTSPAPSTACARSRRCTSVAWAARPTTSTGRPWRGGASPRQRRIQELWLAGRKQEAVAAVPDEYLEQGALIGDEQRIRRRVERVAAGGDRPHHWGPRAGGAAPVRRAGRGADEIQEDQRPWST